MTNPSNSSAGSVQYIVTPTSTTGLCVGSPYTITVTVNPAPMVTTANAATICSGTTTNIALTATTPSTYTWAVGPIVGGITGANSGSGSTISQVLINPSSTNSGSVQYLVTPTVGSCSGTPYAITVTVNPSPAITTPNTAAICSGNSTSIALTSSVPSSFTWTVGTVTGGVTGSGSGSGPNIIQGLTNPSNSTVGTVQYLVTPIAATGSCIGTPYSIVVSVDPKPIVTNAALVNSCSGISTNIALTASFPSNFAWTIGTITGSVTGAIPGSGSSINQVLINPSTSVAGSVDYLITPTSVTGSCVGTPFTITVFVHPAPVVTTANTATICSGFGPNISLNASIPSTFTWTVGAITGGITGASSGSGNTINQVLANLANPTFGTVQYIVTPTSIASSCTGTPYVITVTVNPTPTVTSPLAYATCSGTGPNITVTTSAPSSISWTVGAITGGITGASAGTGATINQPLTNPGNVSAGTVQYIVTPTATSGSCPGITSTITVTVNPIPVLTSVGPVSCCNGLGPNYALTASTPSTFAWTIGPITGGITGASSASGASLNQVLTNPSSIASGTVSYVVTPTSVLGSCVGAPFTILVTVDPSPILITPNTATICSGTSPNISLSASIAGSSFAWTVGAVTGGVTGAGAASGSTINQVLTNPSNIIPGTVQYLVTPTEIATGNSCGTFTITVIVNPKPLVTNSPTLSICSGTSPNLVLTSSVPSNYSWTLGTVTNVTGASASSGTTINQILTNTGNASAGSVVYIVTPLSINDLCTGDPFNITVTVDPKPNVTTLNTAAACSGISTNIPLTATTPSNYAWTIGTITGSITGATVGSGPNISQVLTNPSPINSGSVVFIVTPTALSGSCAGTPYPITVTVYPSPLVTTSNVAATCSGSSPNILLASSTPGTFAWVVGAITGGVTGATAGSGSTINQVLTNPSNNLAGTVQYIVTPIATTGLCSGNTYTITVTVYPKPIVTNSPIATTCSGTGPNIALTASVPSTYAWTIGTITGGITGASAGLGPTINQVLINPNNASSGTVEYIVTPTSAIGSCAGNPFTILVTVHSVPVVITANSAITCSGTSPNITLTASSPSNFAWTIGTITGGITGASAASGAAINQILTNPSQINPGTVAYLVTPTATTGTCAGAPYTITITVNPAPAVTNVNTASRCSGDNTNISLTATIPSTFAWTVSGITGGITGASAGSGSTISQVLNNPTNTTSGTVQYVVTPTSIGGLCVGLPFTITVTVTPNPIVTSANTATICSGVSPNISLTSSVPSNFSWTVGSIVGGITGASAGNGPVINQVLTNPGDISAGTVAYIVTPISMSGTCTGTPFTIIVTVNPVPTVTNSSTLTICSGVSPNISLVASSPSTFSWTIGANIGSITGASSGSGSTINQVLTNPGAVSPGSIEYIVTPLTVSGNCSGVPYKITVTVNPAPAMTNLSLATICSGSSPGINLTSSIPSSYTWTVGPIIGVVTGATTGSGTVINQVLTNPSNINPGSVQYNVTPTATTGSCVGAPFAITVAVDPKPIVTTSNTATICSGSSPNISLTSSIASNFAWTLGAISGGITGASAGSGSSINQVLINTDDHSAGTVQYIVTPTSVAGSCVGSPFTITVTVNSIPSVTNPATATICSGTSPNITLTASSSSTFTWTIGTIAEGITGASSGSGTLINQVLTNPSTSLFGSVKYIITPTSITGSCVGAPYAITVTVDPSPAVTNSATAEICSGTSPNLNLTASAPSTFTWTLGTVTGGITGASSGLGSIINQSLTNPSNINTGTVQYIVTPTALSGSCTGAPFTITVTVNPVPVITTANSVSICSGTSPNINLTSSIPSSYAWTIGAITGGITGASNGSGIAINQVLTNPSGTSPGTVQYVVTPTSSGGSCAGVPYIITVTVNPIPIVTNSATSTICSGTSPNILLSASFASSFTWTIGTITGGITGAIAGSGTTINQLLTNPSALIAGSVVYFVTPTSATGSCVGSPFAITVTVRPSPTVTNAATSSICSGDSPNINLTASTPSDFSWTIGTITGGITGASAGSGVIINQFLTNPSNTLSGTVQYIVTPVSTTGSCPGIPFTITVTVYPVPIVTSPNTATVCSGSNPNINLASSFPSSFTWTIGIVSGSIAGASAGSGSTINQMLTNPSSSFTGSVQYLVTPTSTSGSCAGVPYIITVLVMPSPMVTNSANSTICSGNSPNISLSASSPSTYSWTTGVITGGITGANAGSGSSINQILTNPSTSIPGTVQYLVTPTSIAGTCVGSPFTITVTVNAAPAVTNSATATTCSGTSPNINLTASIASSFTWSIGTITGGITGASPGSGAIINQALTNPSSTTAGTVQYIVTPTATTGACPGVPLTITVTVVPKPLVTNSPTVIICSGTDPNITLAASLPSTFTWTIGVITGGITGTSAGSGSAISQVLTNPSNTIPGTVEFIVVPTSIAGSCTGSPFTITVTVSPAPVITNSAAASICSGASTNLSLTASIASTFTWIIGTNNGGITGAIAGSGSTISQVLNNPSPSVPGTIEYIVTPTSIAGTCIGTPFTITLTITPSPTVTNPASATICSGASPNINLTSSVPSTFAWTLGTVTGGITGASAGSGTIINQSLVNPSNTTPGTVEYIVTPTATTGTCPGVPLTITVTVNPKPIVTNTPSTSTCSGSGANIALTASYPSTFSWAVGAITGGISGASAGSGANINQVLTNPSNTVPGTVAYIVTPTSVSGSCAGMPSTLTVTVYPTPLVTSAATASNCSGTGPVINLTASVASTFTWTIGTISGGITGPIAGSGNIISQSLVNPSSTVSGFVEYIVTPTSVVGSCAGTPFTITVTVFPSPSVTSPATATTCSRTSPNINLTATVASTFNWTIGTITGGITGASAGSGTIINQLLTNPSNTTAGTVQYLVTPISSAGSCAGTPYTITVTVLPAPIVTSSPTTTTCSGSSPNILLTSSLPSTYAWTVGTITGGITGASLGSGSTINQVLTNPSNSIAGTVAYLVIPTSTAGSCAGLPFTITVTVYPTPTVTNAATASTCSGTGPNISLTASVPSTFTWTIGTTTGGITGASTGSGAVINQILTNPSSSVPGSVEYLVSPISTTGACVGSPFTITLTVNPSPTVTNSATSSICSGTSPNINLTASATSSYSWTIGTITGGITGASAGTGAIINQLLTNPSNTLSGTVQYIVTPTATTGTCPGTPFTITVTVYPVSIVTSPNTAIICSGSNPNINLTSSVPGTFSWTIGTVTGGITGASAGSGSTISQVLTNPSSSTFGTVQYLVAPTSTSGTCPGVPYIITVSVNPSPAVTNSATSTICSGTGPNIALTASSPSTYTWTIGTITGGITGSSAGSGSVINQILTNPSTSVPGTVQYLVTPTSTTGSCVGTPFTITVTVNSAPAVTNSATASTCSGTSPNINLTASITSNFTWIVGTITGGITGASAGSGAIINQSLTNPSNTTTGTVQYIVTPTATTGSCAGSPFTITVTVIPVPIITNSTTANACSGSSVNIALTSSIPSTFTWTIGAITGGITGSSAGSGATISQVLTNPSLVSSGTVEYLLTPISVAGSCSGIPHTITVTVNPSAVVTTSNTASICSGSSPNISLTSSLPSNYTWTIGTVTGGITGASAGSGSTINQNLTNPSNLTAGSVAYIVTPTTVAGSCPGAPYTITVTVNPAPIVTTPATAVICSGTSPNINLTSSFPSTFNWTIGTIIGGITGSLPGSGTTINQVLSNPSNSVSGSVDYIVTPTATTGFCAGVPYTIRVTVVPKPIITNSTTATTCSGGNPSIILTSSIPSTFTWTIGAVTGGITGASAGSGSSIAQVLTNPSNTVSGTVAYTVTPTSNASSCVGIPLTITVTVYPAPIVTNPGTVTACSGVSPNITLTSSVSSSFNWTIGTVAGGITGASAGSGSVINQILNNPSASTPGSVEYIVTPVSITGTCAGASFTITVTVNPAPTITNSATTSTCSGTSPNINLTASVPSSFTWIIGTITGGVSGASPGSGAIISQTLTNPSNTTAGTVQYIVTPTATTGSCGGAPFTITVTVTSAPIVTNSSTANACSGSSPNIALTSSIPSTYSWTIGTITGGVTGASAASGAAINQVLTNPSNTISGSVIYIVTPTSIAGSCIGATYPITVTVNPSSIITTPNAASICSGTSSNISLVASIPSNYTWTVGTITGSITGASAGSGSTINQNLINPSNLTAGSVAYIVTPTTVSGSCVGTPYTITVTVNPAPVVTTSATAVICSGSSPNITLVSSFSSTYSWTVGTILGGITGALPGSGSTINQVLSNPSNSASGSVDYIVTPTATAGFCAGAPYPIRVTVTPKPLVINSSTVNICSGASPNIILAASLPSTYTWTIGAITGAITGATGGSGGTINQVLTNLSSANPGTVAYIITPTSISGTCIGDPYTITVTVNPIPVTPVITPAGPVSICSGGSATLSAPAGYTYLWSTGAITQSISVSAAGTYSVVVRDAIGCQSLPGSVTTVITTIASANAGVDATICEGDDYTISGASVSNNFDYIWTTSGTGTFDNPHTLTTKYTPSALDKTNGTVNLTLNASNLAPCLGSVQDVMKLTIQAAPAANAGPNQTVCFPASVLVTGATMPNGHNPVWTLAGAGALFNANTLTPTYQPAAAIGVYSVTLTLTVSAIAPCTGTVTSTKTIQVDALPGNPGVISGPATICKGVPATYSVVAIPNATTYTWTLPSGTTIVSGSNSNNIQVIFNGAAVPANISVFGTNSCGNGPVSNLALTINDIPANPGSIAGPAQICQGSTGVVFTVAPVAGATSYSWTLPTGATITSAPPYSNSVTVTFASNASSGNVTVSASNACGTGPVATKAVVLNAKPATPSISAAGGVNTVCEGITVPLIGAPVGYNYLWTPGGSTTQINQVTVSGAYHVVITDPATGCSSDASNTVTVTIQPAPAPPVSVGYLSDCIVTAPRVPALNANSVTTVAGTAHKVWYDAPTGGNIVALPELSTVGSVTYYCESQDNTTLCPSLTRTAVTVTLATYPNAPVKGVDVSADLEICETNPITALSASTLIAPPAGVVYKWYLNATGGLPVSPTISSIGSKTFYAEADNGVCTSNAPRTPVTLTINPAPVAPVSGGDITQCINSPIQTLTATATAPAGATVRWWDAPSGGNQVVLPALPTLSALGTKTYYAESFIALTTCASLSRTPVTLSIVIHPAPPVVNPNIVECEKSPLQTLTATATVPTGSTIKWYVAASGGLPVSPTLNAVGTATYYAETDNGFCTSLTRSGPVTLTINPAPAPPVSLGNITECATSPIQTLTALASPAGSLWYTTPTGGTSVTPTLNTVGTATFYAESRLGSCASLTRSAPVVLTINATPVKPVSTGDVIECEKSPMQTLTATVTAPTGSTIVWYLSATGGVAIPSPTLNAPGTATYYAESFNGNCRSVDRTAVILTISPAPPAPVSSGNIEKCAEATTITPIDARTKVTSSSPTIEWYTSATGGSAISNPTLDKVGTVSYFAASKSASGCYSLTRTEVKLTINETPEKPIIDNAIMEGCETSPITPLTATATTTTAGATINWYTSLTGGSAVTPTLSKTTTTPVIYYAEAVKGTCVSPGPRPSASLMINAAPAAPKLVTPPLVLCSSAPEVSTGDFSSRVTSVSQVEWFSNSGDVTPLPAGAVPKFSGLPVGTTTYYAGSINSAGCQSLTRIPVLVTINASPADPVTSKSEDYVCATGSGQTLTATATSPDGATIKWYKTSTGGSAISGQPSVSVATPAAIDYYAEASNGTCLSAHRTKVSLWIVPAPGIPVVGFTSKTVCEGSTEIPLLATATSAASATINWYTSQAGGSPVSSPELSAPGTVTYYAEGVSAFVNSNVGYCISPARSVPVVLTITAAPADPVSGGDISECATSPVQTLTAKATTSAGATIVWYSTLTGGNPISGLPILNTPAQSPKTYYAEAINGTCKSANRTPVTLTLSALPLAPARNSVLSVKCAESPLIYLDARDMITVPANAVIDWYLDAAGGAPISTPPVLNQVGSFTYYAESVYASGCRSLKRTPVILTIHETPTNPVGNNITDCSTAIVPILTAVATSSAGAIISWYDTQTSTTPVIRPTLTSIANSPKTYWAEATIGTCKSVNRTPITLAISPAPAAPVLNNKISTECEKLNQILDARDYIATQNSSYDLAWYNTAVGGVALDVTAYPPVLSTYGSVTYYAETVDKISDCRSSVRTPVILTITQAPAKPVGINATACVSGAQPPVLTATVSTPPAGVTTLWYATETATIPINVTTNPLTWNQIGTKSYWAEAISGSCASIGRTEVKLTISPSFTASAMSNSPVSLGGTLFLSGKTNDLITPTDYSYLWTSPAGVTYTTSSVSIKNITSLDGGTYKLTVTSKSTGCTSSTSVTVIVNTGNAGYQPVCMGGTLNLIGQPSGMKTYSWTGPNGFTSLLQNPFIDNVTAANAGTYTLVTTDPSGISTPPSVVDVKINPLPDVFALTNSPVCPNGTLQLNAGPDLMVSYLWSGPGITSAQSSLQNLNINAPATQSDYTLTVTDINGCAANVTVSVALLVAKPSFVPICSGSKLRLIGEPNGMSKYEWTGPNGFTSNMQSPTIDKSTPDQLLGTYTLKVYDNNNCASLPVSVNVTLSIPAAVITANPASSPLCEGTNLTLTGEPTGNPGQYTYLWTGPNGFTSTLKDPPVITGIKTINAGMYQLVVTDVLSTCSTTAQANIQVTGVTMSGSYGPFCENDSKVALSASPAGVVFTGNGISQGTTGVYYFDPAVAKIGIHPIFYSYTGVGCNINSSFDIEVVTNPLVVTNTVALTSCTATNGDITLPAVTAGSTAGLKFTYWTDAKATTAVPTPNAVGAGIYYIKGATASGKCWDIQPVSVVQPDLLHADMTVSATLKCAGDSTGTITAKVTLGTAPFTYLWSTRPVQTTQTAINLRAGVYTVVITDAVGCSSAVSAEVKEPAPLKLYFASKNIQCMSDANGSARVDSINGSGDIKILNSFKYLWSTIPVQTTREAVRLTALWHRVSLTNEMGCIHRDSVYIEVQDTIPPSIICPKNIDMTVQFIKSTDGTPNKYVVDLGKPFATDNCAVDTIANDAPVKFRTGLTEVVWTVTDQMGLTDTCRQYVMIKEIPTIPQLISPNGDGVNDTFVIDGLDQFPGTQLSVFTRSGQLVYQNKDYNLPENAWNGRYSESNFSKNKLVAPGVYYYLLKLGGNSGQLMKGFVYVYY
ncbi:MAG: PKD-like domain-containing protein [Prolixibacteraceae bacterium]